MRLYLAVAVLMLAFVAYTEAQEEETIEQKFTNFGNQMAEVSKDLAEKAKTAFGNVHNSEFAENTRNWFRDMYEKAKAKAQEIAQ